MINISRVIVIHPMGHTIVNELPGLWFVNGLCKSRFRLRQPHGSQPQLGKLDDILNKRDKAARLLKKGGTLLYSTCSVLAEENGAVIERAERAGLRLLPVELPCGIERLPSPEGTACVLPGPLYEGFFLAMFKK